MKWAEGKHFSDARTNDYDSETEIKNACLASELRVRHCSERRGTEDRIGHVQHKIIRAASLARYNRSVCFLIRNSTTQKERNATIRSLGNFHDPRDLQETVTDYVRVKSCRKLFYHVVAVEPLRRTSGKSGKCAIRVSMISKAS